MTRTELPKLRGRPGNYVSDVLPVAIKNVHLLGFVGWRVVQIFGEQFIRITNSRRVIVGVALLSPPVMCMIWLENIDGSF